MNQVEYTCRDCGKPFRAKQGSRRNYCNRCATRRIMAGRKLKRKSTLRSRPPERASGLIGERPPKLTAN